jgi:hypothetical protein
MKGNPVQATVASHRVLLISPIICLCLGANVVSGVNSLERNLLGLRIVEIAHAFPRCSPGVLTQGDLGLAKEVSRSDYQRTSSCATEFSNLRTTTQSARLGGFLLLAQEQHKQAQNVLIHTPEYVRGDSFTEYLLGLAAWRAGDTESAVRLWRKASPETLWLRMAWDCAVRIGYHNKPIQPERHS